MGGATFPSAVKLHLRDRLALHTLVMNGAECEPFLTCDDRLMREHADKVAAGVALMARALGVDRTRIAIETNKPEAAAAMTEAVKAFPGIAVVRVPTRYPMGSEKHLVQTLTGIETPARALTADMGVVVHNIATAFGWPRVLTAPLVDRLERSREARWPAREPSGPHGTRWRRSCLLRRLVAEPNGFSRAVRLCASRSLPTFPRSRE